MQEPYDIIKRARDLLAATPERELKAATTNDYATKVKRFLSKLGTDRSTQALIQEALNTTKKATWQANRAALIFSVKRIIRKNLSSQDKLQRDLKALAAAGSTPDQAEWLKAVTLIGYQNDALQKVLDAKLPLEGRENRHTKRQDMRGLPDDWRERIIARMPKYAAQALVAAVTGCRPAELAAGVELEIDSKGRLVARIKGAKLTEKSGQAWRNLFWPSDSASPLVQSLFDLVRKQSEGFMFRVAIDNAKAFSGAMRAAGKREWPKRKSTVTPYCMRHQAAADMKASGSLSSAEMSAALGHVSDVTKSTYGHANMGRKLGGVVPLQVDAARPVQIKKPSWAAFNRVVKHNPATPLDESKSPGMSL